jgi:hypothetical protein
VASARTRNTGIGVGESVALKSACCASERANQPDTLAQQPACEQRPDKAFMPRERLRGQTCVQQKATWDSETFQVDCEAF